MNADQYNYATVTQALDDLKARGYVDEFNFKDKYLFCNDKGIQFNPQELKITEVYRFEGATDPEDSSVVYAIESELGLKGVMIDAYGVYADEQKTAFINSLKMAD
jgi:Fe2+ or Zn2+ uptake regulation protein